MTTIPAPTLAIPQCLYRFYDAAGRLLYIGITWDLGGRWGHHNRHKPWWREVVRATVAHYPDRPSVEAAERAAIWAERPIHNVIHNRRDPAPWSAPQPVQGRGLYDMAPVFDAINTGLPVWLCEQIADVAMLRSYGAVATCDLDGRGCWRDEYAERFAGADITVLGMRDRPGWQHAARVINTLMPTAAAIRFVRPAVGGNAHNHFYAGRTLDEFVLIDTPLPLRPLRPT